MHDPFTREAYSRDPRNIARKAEQYINESGVADVAYFGPEAEFYMFDSVRFDTTENASFHEIDSESRLVEHRRGRGRAATRATRSSTRAATSRSPRPTTSPTCATRSC